MVNRPTRRLVVVLDYEVADLQGDALDRIAGVLRERAVHEPIEGARQRQAWVAGADVADEVIRAISPYDDGTPG